MGSIGCSEKSETNYHFMLCNISQECRSHMMIWCCRFCFRLAWYGSE